MLELYRKVYVMADSVGVCPSRDMEGELKLEI